METGRFQPQHKENWGLLLQVFAAPVNHSCTQISTATELPSAYQHAGHENCHRSALIKGQRH